MITTNDSIISFSFEHTHIFLLSLAISPSSYNTQVYAADVAPRRITDKSAIFHQMGLWFRGIIPASHYNSDLRGVPGSIPGGSILFCFCFFLLVIYIRSIYLRFVLLLFILCRWCWNSYYVCRHYNELCFLSKC